MALYSLQKEQLIRLESPKIEQGFSLANYLDWVRRNSLHWIVAVGRGSYFLMNLFGLFCTFFLGETATTPIILAKASLSMVSTLSFLYLFTAREKQEHANFQALEDRLKKLSASFKHKTAEFNREYYNSVMQECSRITHKTTRKYHPKTVRYKRTFSFYYNRLFEFLNAGKDLIRSAFIIASMSGLSISIAHHALNPTAFFIFCAVSAAFGLCASLEYHYNQQRNKKMQATKKKIFFLERELRKLPINHQEIKLFRLTQKSTSKARTPSQLDDNTLKKVSINNKWLAILFGLFNGLYFGFTIHELFFSTIAAISAPWFVPVSICIFFSFAWTYQAYSQEIVSQKMYLAALNKKASCEKFFTHREHPMEIPKLTSAVTPHRKTFQQYYFNFIDGGRAIANMSKLAMFGLRLFGVSMSLVLPLGFLGAFGLASTLAIISVAVSIAGIGIYLNEGRNFRRREIKNLEAEITFLKNKIQEFKSMQKSEYNRTSYQQFKEAQLLNEKIRSRSVLEPSLSRIQPSTLFSKNFSDSDHVNRPSINVNTRSIFPAIN